ncbi:hypothetical protein G9L34_000193 [Enterococcus hirae]|nr:hypothetical protein [Enterococcus hirae]EMF0243976.1 hypothetical protein [Enterococcus hirae]EMF0384616.1 hypothetical protein [Enterococcus hirae]EMF0424667.1 hypothetical protein [Enterococcus hirae]EMF0437155.1 hypothetical protein [Enterococcus hirae]
MVGYIRFAALALIGLSYLGFRLKKKKDHQSETLENDWSQYQKNEERLYPWEEDQDDSPQRIEKTATRYVNQARPRRGKW